MSTSARCANEQEERRVYSAHVTLQRATYAIANACRSCSNSLGHERLGQHNSRSRASVAWLWLCARTLLRALRRRCLVLHALPRLRLERLDEPDLAQRLEHLLLVRHVVVAHVCAVAMRSRRAQVERQQLWRASALSAWRATCSCCGSQSLHSTHSWLSARTHIRCWSLREDASTSRGKRLIVRCVRTALRFRYTSRRRRSSVSSVCRFAIAHCVCGRSCVLATVSRNSVMASRDVHDEVVASVFWRRVIRSDCNGAFSNVCSVWRHRCARSSIARVARTVHCRFERRVRKTELEVGLSAPRRCYCSLRNRIGHERKRTACERHDAADAMRKHRARVLVRCSCCCSCSWCERACADCKVRQQQQQSDWQSARWLHFLALCLRLCTAPGVSSLSRASACSELQWLAHPHTQAAATERDEAMSALREVHHITNHDLRFDSQTTSGSHGGNCGRDEL